MLQDLAALTPPLVVCAVVIIAIVAFLRREMGEPEADEPDPADPAEHPDQAVSAPTAQENHSASPDARLSDWPDGQPRHGL